jgi:hypothetical protein
MPKLTKQQVQAATSQGYEDKSEELKPLPVGNGEAYVYKLVSCEEGPTRKNPNKIQWTWTLTLDGRYHPDLVGAGYLEKIWYYTALDGGNEWAIAKVLHAFGYVPETDTDELINDEATVLVFPTTDTYGTPPKISMKVRRLAAHDEADYPQAVSPMEQEAREYLDAHAAKQAAAAAPAAVAPAPAEDPWAVGPQDAVAVIPPQAAGEPEDEF